MLKKSTAILRRVRHGVRFACGCWGAGLNTGSVLIRNTEWSRTLIADMATYGKYPVDWSKEEMLRAAVPSYDIGMYEQNMLVWRLMNEPDIMAKVGDCLLTFA